MVRSLGALIVALVVLVGLFLVLRPESRAAGTRERTFEVSVEDGEMVPRELRVGEGDRVTLRVEAGEPVELHLHGYGIEWGSGPGEGDAVSFGAGNARDTEDEYEASPLLTVGFDHLFLGMGLVLISTLAVMTLVFALATNDEPAVSQIREPAVPGTPSEIALAGNVLERPDRQPQAEEPAPNAGGGREDGRSTNESDDKPENEPATSRDEDEDRPEQRPENASSKESLFEGVKFVPMPPSSPPATSPASSAAPASAAASASPDATASPPPPGQTPVPASPEPTSPAPASPAPASPVPTTDTPAATAPAATVSTGAPAAEAVPPEAVPPEAVSPGAAGSEATPGSATAEPAPTVTQPVPVTSGAPNGQGPLGSRPGDLNVSRLVDGIDARVEDAVGPVR